MSLDIGEAFGEGVSRLVSSPGLALVVAFAVVTFLSAILSQTLQVEGLEAVLETVRATDPSQLDVSQAEYDRQLATLEEQTRLARESSPLALEVPLSMAAAGLLAVALGAEAVSIVAVRAFATDPADAVDARDVTGGLGLATLNGFVGGIVVWGLVIVGSVFLLFPGLFFAVAFYFLRQEIALEDENFIDGLAASWRLTKGNRVTVFALGLLVVVVSQLSTVAGLAVGTVSPLAAVVVSAILGGLLAAFGAAVVTRAYLQLKQEEADVEPTADPYDAALGPDDIPE